MVPKGWLVLCPPDPCSVGPATVVLGAAPSAWAPEPQPRALSCALCTRPRIWVVQSEKEEWRRV